MNDSPRIEEITPEELFREIRGESHPFILDVRNEEEFDAWTIEGVPADSICHIPYFTFLEDEARCVAQVPRDRQVTVVCAKGGSSAFVASILAQYGIQARNLQGGMLAWGDLHTTSKVPAPAELKVALYQINRVGKRCLSYVIVSDGEAMAIDVSRYIEHYSNIAQGQNARITQVLDTHLHADHLSGGPAISRSAGIPYYIRLDEADGAQFPYHMLEDGAHLTLGSSIVEIIAIHTPGHTPGSTSLLVNEQYLLTGDTLFVSSIGRPDLGDKAAEWARLLFRTLFERIARLPDDVLILPAHYAGLGEMRPDGVVATTIGDARAHNPVFQQRTEQEFLEFVLAHLPAQPRIYQDIRLANLGRKVYDAEQAIEAELGPNQCAAVLPPPI